VAQESSVEVEGEKELKYDIIFVSLNYRSDKDLIEFLESLKGKGFSYRVIMVEAYYDDECTEKFTKIAEQYDMDRIPIENKGYSYGNNVGIQYAMEKYDFDYLVVSNPDVVVNKMTLQDIKACGEAVIGPKITTARGTQQNPVFIKEHRFLLWISFKGFKRNSKILVYLGILLNKIFLMLELTARKKILPIFPVFQIHGAFLIFPKTILEKLGKVYDDTIFMFAEESYLSKHLQNMGIKSVYNEKIDVYHKEDGDNKFRDDLNEHILFSNRYIYSKYYDFH